MDVFLLVCLTMLCLMGALSLIGFVIRNFFVDPVIMRVQVVPLSGNGEQVERKVKAVLRMLYWEDAQMDYILVDCGLDEKSVQAIRAKKLPLYSLEVLPKTIQDICQKQQDMIQ